MRAALALTTVLALAGPALGEGEQPARDRAAADRELAHGQLAYQKKRYDEAVRHLTKAARLGADPPTVKLWRGMAYLWLEKYRSAESDLMVAASRWPENVSIRKALGQAQMAQSKFMWAMRQFKFVLQQKPSDASVLVNLGYCLMRMEAYEEAAKLLDKAARETKSKRLAQRAKVLMGVCHYRRNELSRARALLLGLRTGQWQRGARRVLALILSRESGVERGWSASVSLGAGTDTNPTMGEEPLPGWSRSGDAALDLTLSARFSWTPLVRGPHSLAGRVAVDRHFYLAPWDLDGSHERVSAFSMTTVEAGGDYKYSYLTRTGPRALRVGYLFRLVQLDGGEGLPGEDDPFLFSETHGLVLGWQRQSSPNRTFELSVTPSYTAFRDRDRDGPGVRASGRWSLFYDDRKLKIFPEVFAGYDHGRWEAWRYGSAGVWLGVSYLGPWAIDFSGSLSHESRLHPQSKNAFGEPGPNVWQLEPDTYRHDHVTSAAVGVGRAVDERRIWRVDLSVRYMRSWSTAEFFKYSRLTALLSVSATLDDETFNEDEASDATTH
jgi:Flp pilus assembly protein TadD